MLLSHGMDKMAKTSMKTFCSLVILVSFVNLVTCSTNYLIGTGIADITGPAAEVNMMGYANPSQTSRGIHIRQYSRAFIIADSSNKTRVVFISVDTGMPSQLVKLEVVTELKKVYGDLYTERNILITSIHTHSGPAGFLQYILFDITSLGFVMQTFFTFVGGVVQSVKNAHNNIQPGNILINAGELLDSNINRSPAAYVNNPEDEKAKYKYNVDKKMTLLKFVDANGGGLGMINWFAVHCTSMNNTNRLISGDNKGYASQMFEKLLNNNSLPGKGKFVAAFAQSNEGDVSPNTKGPHCTDSGLPCDILTSTCHGKNELCIASGPGKDMVESTKIIGENQLKKAVELYNSASTMVSGPVNFRHSYVDMTNVEVQVNATTTVKTCKPAMGFSFAAGTTDGPGMFGFKQGDKTGNLFWDLVRDFLKEPSDAQIQCHAPKPILLDTGEITTPYQWQPFIVDTQIIMVGSVAIIAVPGEFSTMSGRRLRDAVAQTLVSGGMKDVTPVIAGLSNDYADYIATYEEYQIQRYEGASTIYGPHTLKAYIQQFNILAEALAKNETVAPGPDPPNLYNKQLSFLPPVIFDRAPSGKKFGGVVQAPQPSYTQGQTVKVSFISGNPRNSVGQIFESFLTVERNMTTGWAVVYTDANWDTIFEWERTSTLLGESEVTITWNIALNQTVGTYRIGHTGHSKSIGGTITEYTGMTTPFQLVKAPISMEKELSNLFNEM